MKLFYLKVKFYFIPTVSLVSLSLGRRGCSQRRLLSYKHQHLLNPNCFFSFTIVGLEGVDSQRRLLYCKLSFYLIPTVSLVSLLLGWRRWLSLAAVSSVTPSVLSGINMVFIVIRSILKSSNIDCFCMYIRSSLSLS